MGRECKRLIIKIQERTHAYVIVLNATSVIQWVVERSAVDRQPCTKSAAPWVANPVQKLQQWGLSTLAKERIGLSTRHKQCGAAACKRRAGNVVARGNSEMGHATRGVIVLWSGGRGCRRPVNKNQDGIRNVSALSSKSKNARTCV